MSWRHDYEFPRYVSAAERQSNVRRELAKLTSKGGSVQPIKIEGRQIANSFWGKAWCENLESYMDFANRLPRGRTYVRNGCVVHLEINPGEVLAKVCGSELYRVRIKITPFAQRRWQQLCRECAGGIASLVELLQGRLSDRVMDIITRKQTGLFPSPAEVDMDCSCPDMAGMCKHIAAVFYGIGARLDQSPELLFRLRSVDHQELITQAATVSDLTTNAAPTGPELSENEMGAVFGIELDTSCASAPVVMPASPAADSATAPQAPAKKAKRRIVKRPQKRSKPAARSARKAR